jgi:hypothetical protein
MSVIPPRLVTLPTGSDFRSERRGVCSSVGGFSPRAEVVAQPAGLHGSARTGFPVSAGLRFETAVNSPLGAIKQTA